MVEKSDLPEFMKAIVQDKPKRKNKASTQETQARETRIFIEKNFPVGFRDPAIEYTLTRNGTSMGYILSLWPEDTRKPVYLHIVKIHTESERGKGLGSILIREFLKDVDNANRSVFGHVEGKGKTQDQFIAYANRNVRFYKKFGFVLEDPAWENDFSWIGPYMSRGKQRNDNKVKKRTPQQQHEREYEGNEIQKLVKADLERFLTSEDLKRTVRLYPAEGIDIKVKNGKTVSIEVKSARQWERTDTGKTRGRFLIKPEDFKADFFAFVVKGVDPSDLSWDRSKPVTIHYIKARDVERYFKTKFKAGFAKQRKNFKLSINEMRRLPVLEQIPAKAFE